MTDAEKGDAVIELAETTGESYKDIAEKELSKSYQSVRIWVYKANRTSKKLRQCLESQTLSDKHTFRLLKCAENRPKPHCNMVCEIFRRPHNLVAGGRLAQQALQPSLRT